jgi:hypothetical protein
MKQLTYLKNEPKAYGGSLLKTRAGRSRPRPLETRTTMHLVLRSSKAKGPWSFKQTKNEKRIREIVSKFSAKHGVKVLSLANVGNHLHFQIKLSNRYTYRPFIRATTAAIAMAITGASRWKPLKTKASDRFWDRRPFTRIVHGLRAFLDLRDYVRLNQMEGEGMPREIGRWVMHGPVLLE